MFRYKKSLDKKYGIDYDLQGHIYFTSKQYKKLPVRTQRKVLNLCMAAGGEYYQALFELVTTNADPVTVCRKHFLSQSTLERIVRKYYIRFAESI